MEISLVPIHGRGGQPLLTRYQPGVNDLGRYFIGQKRLIVEEELRVQFWDGPYREERPMQLRKVARVFMTTTHYQDIQELSHFFRHHPPEK